MLLLNLWKEYLKANNIFLFTLLLLYLVSCQTNKAPRWIEEPPADDDLYIYIVGIGEDDNVFDSVIDQLNSRFNIKENSYITDLLLNLMKESYNQTLEANDEILSILDRWDNKDLTYILVRLDRDFFDPLIELFSTQYDEMLAYRHENETEADALLEEGELYSAASLYLSALDYMLEQNNDFYTLSILSVIDKLTEVLGRLSYSNIETFDLLKIAHPIGDNKLSINYIATTNENFSGFLYDVNFIEGWETRTRDAIVLIRENSLVFVPPAPKISGTFNIDAKLNLNTFLNVVKPWLYKDGLSKYLNDYIDKIQNIVNDSFITFDYDVISELETLPKIIAFNNENISEGIVRYLLENEQEIQVSPITFNDDSLLNYVREVNRITDNLYRYMILGGEILEDRVIYEGGTLVTLDGEIFLVDLYSSTIITSRKITSEFLVQNDEEDLIYLDYGLKVGEVISTLSY